MLPITYHDQAISEMEDRIMDAINQKQQEVFGDREVVLKDQDYQNVRDFVFELLKDFPSAENGSKFIKCHFSLNPILVIDISLFKTILEGEGIPKEVGKTIVIGKVVNDLFGTIFPESTQLELTNIYSPDNKLTPNEWTEERFQEEKKNTEGEAAFINKPLHIGSFNLDQNLQKGKMRADIRFGQYFAQDQEFEVRTTYQEFNLNTTDPDVEIETAVKERSVKWLIRLPSLVGKIKPDGSVTLPNEKQFYVNQVPNLGGVIINLGGKYDFNLNIDVI